MKHTALRKNSEFVRVYKRGKSFVHPLLVLYLAKNRTGATRLGITASKKVGGAVQRNRARRLLRAAACQVLPHNVGGWDLVLVARGATGSKKSGQVADALRGLLKKAEVQGQQAGGGP